LFSRQDVWRAWNLQGRVCKLCGRSVPFDLIHGDHVVAWADGGRTVAGNLQALCGSCNLRKGRRPQAVVRAVFDPGLVAPGCSALRSWQAAALPVVLEAIGREPVLVEACPGAGKTQFGLEVAYRLIAGGLISRVLVVVPTLAIADGWHRAASPEVPAAPSLPLRSQRDWRAVDPIGEQWLGAVITYQSLFASTEMFLAHATDPGHRTLVIFDEVHHAGAGAAWGTSAREAFAAGAAAILSLSGTPFRTGGDPIVFVPSEAGETRPHYRYSYAQAIGDGACRPVQFVQARGQAVFRAGDGREYRTTFDESLSPAGERRRLRAALEWAGPGSIAEKMLADANRFLVGLRRAGDTDAAGLVVCVDCGHADAIAQLMSDRVTGMRPVVACSRQLDINDADPANAIRRFRRSHDPWIVAVNMVSEGVDIPRLRVVVYLTNRLTVLAFRQIIGRVVRTDPANASDYGRVYIPADRHLVDMARQVTSQVRVLPPAIVIELDDPPRPPAGGRAGDPPGTQAFQALLTRGEQGDAFDTQDRDAAAVLIACAQRFIEREGLTGTDPESLALAAADVPELRDALLAMRET
jgi:superfamily II DNA or RNA helicase